MKFTELWLSAEIPKENEFIVPVYLDHTDNALRRISVADLASAITKCVIDGQDITMEQSDNGIKFKKMSNKERIEKLEKP